VSSRLALSLLLVVSLLCGAVAEYCQDHFVREPGWWRLVSTASVVLLMFSWYYCDSRARAFRRSRSLDFGVVALALVAVPYYLVRSRPRGKRFRALLNLVGYCVLLMLSSIAGALIMFLVS